nr:MAG TPA: helix-turn-helix domain protein [Bacteriophage sp.]
MEENNQHVQLPVTEEKSDLRPKDQLIYLSIKRFMNKDTHQAFPSLEKLKQVSGASIPTIRDSIQKLVDTNYISVTREGRKNIYTFNTYKNFEPFSYEFLDNESLSFNEKAFIVATQKYMYKEEEGLGKIGYSNRKLADLISMTEGSIRKYNNSLKDKELLTYDIQKDGTTVKVYHLDKMLQNIIWVLANHEKRISDIEKENAELKSKFEELEKLVKKSQQYIL